MDPDPGGPKTCGSGSPTRLGAIHEVEYSRPECLELHLLLLNVPRLGVHRGLVAVHEAQGGRQVVPRRTEVLLSRDHANQSNESDSFSANQKLLICPRVVPCTSAGCKFGLRQHTKAS